MSQICHALREVDGEFNVRKEQGRIYVEAESEFDYEETVEALQHVFGIVGICPVIMAQDEGFDALAQMVVAHVKEVYGDKSLTFKVDARRARKNYPMTSMEINAELGGRILDACPNMSVDVHDPDVMSMWRSEIRSIFIRVRYRDREECRLVQTARQCCCFPEELTVRLPDT